MKHIPGPFEAYPRASDARPLPPELSIGIFLLPQTLPTPLPSLKPPAQPLMD